MYCKKIYNDKYKRNLFKNLEVRVICIRSYKPFRNKYSLFNNGILNSFGHIRYKAIFNTSVRYMGEPPTEIFKGIGRTIGKAFGLRSPESGSKLFPKFKQTNKFSGHFGEPPKTQGGQESLVARRLRLKSGGAVGPPVSPGNGGFGGAGGPPVGSGNGGSVSHGSTIPSNPSTDDNNLKKARTGLGLV